MLFYVYLSRTLPILPRAEAFAKQGLPRCLLRSDNPTRSTTHEVSSEIFKAETSNTRKRSPSTSYHWFNASVWVFSEILMPSFLMSFSHHFWISSSQLSLQCGTSRLMTAYMLANKRCVVGDKTAYMHCFVRFLTFGLRLRAWDPVRMLSASETDPRNVYSSPS